MRSLVMAERFIDLPPKEAKNTKIYRRFRLVEKGLVRLDQRIIADKVETGTDITGKYWVFGLIKIKKGQIQYLHGDRVITPDDRFFGMFVPPYNIIEVKLTRSDSSSKGLASSRPLPVCCPKTPVIFKPYSSRCPESLEEMVAFLTKSAGFVKVSREDGPSPLSLQVKEKIDHRYSEAEPLSKIASDVMVSHAQMTRYFKKDYGRPPSQYRASLRIMDGMMRLLAGQTIMDVSQDVGFSDLSRFYKQFGRIAQAPPARYRVGKSKNAKT